MRPPEGAYLLNIFAPNEVHCLYNPRDEVEEIINSTIFTEPEANNCFSIISGQNNME